MVHLTRQVRFSAAHRYFLPNLSDEENRRLFGSSVPTTRWSRSRFLLGSQTMPTRKSVRFSKAT